MTWELYEVWGIDEAGHEELLETTSSKKQAFEIAESSLGLGYFEIIVYQENEDGDMKELERFEHG
jgi:hypothetical protein